MQSMGPRKGPEDAKYAHERKDDAGKLHYKFRGKQGNPHHATEHTSPSHHEREHGEDVSFTEANLNDEKPEREEDVETRETEFIKQQREGVRFEQFGHIPVSHAEVRAIAGSQGEYDEMMRDLEKMPGGGGVLLHTGAKLYYQPNEDAFFIGMYHHDGSDGRDIVTELEAGKTHLLAGQQHHHKAA